MAEQNWKTDGYDPSKNGWWKASLGEDVNNFGYPSNYNFADSIRATVIAFGNYFNNLYVVRYDENGYPRKKIRIPIKFGPRAKSHDYRKELESGTKYYIPQPNMTYKITGISYNGNRESSPNRIRTFYETYLTNVGISAKQINLLWSDVRPVPYDMTVELCANCDKMSDATQILEQICARFRPDSYLYVKEFWFMNIRRDIKMILESTSLEYNEDYGEEDKREISVKFSLKLETNIYTGIEAGTIIDKIYTTLNPSVANIIEKELVYKFKTDLDGVLLKDGDRYHVPEVSLSALIGIDNVPSEYKESTVFDYMYTYNSGTQEYSVRDSLFEDGYVTKELINPSAGDSYYECVYRSAYSITTNDPYTSNTNIYGNYKPNYDSYDEATMTYDASLVDRWDLINNVIEGKKDIIYGNDKISAPYVITNTDNGASKK